MMFIRFLRYVFADDDVKRRGRVR